MAERAQGVLTKKVEGIALESVKNKTSRTGWLVVVLAVLVMSVPVSAENPRFGPYEAIHINSDVIRGVKVDEDRKIWLLLNPAHREKELILKGSNAEGSGYRKWENGSEELVSPANQGKAPNQWTDWVRTRAPYVEYWMDGKKVLHLKKVGTFDE